ncbi:MAG: hypothetical protein WCQ67_08820 [Treponema sp.]
MEDLKEINMGSNNVVLKNNRVTSSILPKNTSELQQNITVDENVIIEGAVYTNNLEISNGPAEFKGAVFANNELHIKNDCAHLIYFNKAVASAKSVVSLLSAGNVIYGADINAPSVKLKNAFVCGSIYGNEIQLENSVVLGGVFAAKTLSEHNCIVGTFNSPEVNAGGVNYMLYPTSFSVEPIALLPETEFWNIALADLGSLFKGESEKTNTGKIKMDMLNDTQRTVLTDENGAKSLVNSYSVASRVLVSDLVDFDKMENHFLIISASLGSQVLKRYSIPTSTGEKGPELSVKNIAQFFFSILAGKVQIQEISGEIDFKELKKKFE